MEDNVFKQKILDIVYDLANAIEDLNDRILSLEEYGTSTSVYHIKQEIWNLESTLQNSV